MTSDEKIENLLFVIWIQDQRNGSWMKVVKEIKGELEKLREEMEDGDKLFNGSGSEIFGSPKNRGVGAGGTRKTDR